MLDERNRRDLRVSHALAELELPAESSDFFAQLRARALSRDRRASWRLRTFAAARPLALVGLTALLFAVAGGLAGGLAVAATQEDSADPPVLAFNPASGWSTLQTQDDAGAGVEFAWAANVPFAAADTVSGQLTETARQLPAAGILVYVSSLREVPDDSGYRDVGLPIQVVDGDFFTGMYENQPASHVSKYQINAYVNKRYVYVEVMFGAPRPDARLIAAAQEELNRLVVPEP
jgi:hypothetical protein